jgi:hypothetical protein
MHVKFIEILPYCSGNLQTSFSSLRLGKSTLSELLTLLSELLTLLSEILTPLSERSRGERITPRLRSGCMCPNRGACVIRGIYLIRSVHILGIMLQTNSLPLYSSFIQIPTQKIYLNHKS